MRERVIAFGLIATALLTASPRLFQALQYNLIAVPMTSTCMGNARMSQPIGSAWFEMWSASCAGEVESAWDAKREVIVLNSDRLEVVRATARYDEALAQLAATTYPDSPEAHLWLGDALREKNDVAGALAAYWKGVALNSTNADAWMSLGRLHEERGDLQLAVEAYDQACAFVDKGKNGCPSAGRIYLATGMYDLAAVRFEMSLQQIDEGWLPGREGLVKALLASGRAQEAIPHLIVLAESGSAEARETLLQLGEFR